MMGAVLPKMPDAATDTHFPSIHPSPLDFSTADNMKMHLQHLLDSKGKQLQQAGSLGQCILAQQKELEEQIKQIQDAMAAKEMVRRWARCISSLLACSLSGTMRM